MSSSISGSMSYTPPGSEISTPDGGTGTDYLSSIDDALDEMLDELSGDVEVSDPVTGCPCNLPVGEEVTLKSIHIDFGWTFSGGSPTGSYSMTLCGQNFFGPLDAGGIRIDSQLFSKTGVGMLEIHIDNGPVFSADISLDLPAIQTEAGLVRRLTNLGWHAGNGDAFDERAAWAVRAFKRVVVNGYSRGKTVVEDDQTDAAFLASLQDAYGAHPEDQTAAGSSLVVNGRGFFDCQLFGQRSLLRSSFEVAGAADDQDPGVGAGPGIWAGQTTAAARVPIAGPYCLYLRAFDPDAGEPVMPNRINLPQPVLMAKFVLWELGYWLVGGAPLWSTISGTGTRLGYCPAGNFDRDLQWAVREFQCYAKSTNAAREQTGCSDRRYIRRLLAESPQPLVGEASYPADGRVSGALNQATRQALQAWADQRLRCPAVIYSSTDVNNAAANGSDLDRVQRENLWIHNEHATEDVAMPMFCLDWSGLYRIPQAYGGVVVVPGGSLPRPIIVGRYESDSFGGPVALPFGNDPQCWVLDAEVTPGNLIGAGGTDGAGLSAEHLAWFKVVRTAAHFECLAYFDVLNAWDDVGISFGTCHWTAARTDAGAEPDEARELPAFLAYFRFVAADAYEQAFGRFGIVPSDVWPLPLVDATRNYLSCMEMHTEGGTCNLAGLGGSNNERKHNNKYCKTWHSFWRYQMACRTSTELRHAQWDLTRIRVRDVLEKSYTINGNVVAVSEVATSQKAAAMLLRWHIRNPPSLLTVNNRLQDIVTDVLAAHPNKTQAREDALIARLDTDGSPHTDNALQKIRNSVNVITLAVWGHQLNLQDPVLSSQLDSLPALTGL